MVDDTTDQRKQVAQKMMELVNACKGQPLTRESAETLVTILHPWAPHIAEELWSRLGHTGSIYGASINAQLLLNDDPRLQKILPEWPKVDPSRPCYVGIDPGADHPFAAVLLVNRLASRLIGQEELAVQRGFIKRQRIG